MAKPRFTLSRKRKVSKENIYVTVIGDSHDGPHLPDKSRFEWIGKYVRANKPDIVIHIGDLFDLYSLNQHEPNSSVKGRQKTTYDEDLESGRLALESYENGIGSYTCMHHITLGNHEDRAFRFMDANPELQGFIDFHLYQLLEQHGWTYSEFGKLHYVGGVAFTHVPLNAMNRPFGGMHSENQIANHSLESLVYGHTHRRLCKSFSKLGRRNIQICNVGSSMPNGHVEPYAKLSSGAGWSYGIMDIKIRNGHIRDHWIAMDELQDMFG